MLLSPRLPALFSLIACGLVIAASESAGADLPPPVDRKVDFQSEIQPIFVRACYQCHGPEKQKSGYRLDQAELAIKGGELGAAIVPGKSADSPLVRYVAGVDADLVMPPEGPRLARNEVALLRAWIDQGASWPVGKAAAQQTWWSLAPLVRPVLPTVSEQDAARVRTPIDAFILAKLREQKLAPSPEADPRTLIRRLYFDLIGLPPSPEEVERFVSATGDREKVYGELVDRLLASPAYGERWARHWLDVVRYGDTHGYDKDQPRPNAWPYRDYVIRALNEDRPYRRFVQEQIAGDVLLPGTPDGIEALGFIAAGPWDLIGHIEVPEAKIDGQIARMLDRDDMVSNTMNTFTSMTVQCARCHNHKFDPVTQEDYYSLQAVFAAVDRADKKYDLTPATAARRATLTAQRQSLQARIDKIRSEVSEPVRAELAKLDAQIKELEAQKTNAASKAAQFGYHSQLSPKQDLIKWVQVDLGKPVQLSRVVLHACEDGFNGIGAGFGFPVRYKVEVSDDPAFATGVTAIADYTQADVINPKLAPVEIETASPPARYIRLTATKLALRMNDYILAIAELDALDSDGTNVAAGAPVTAFDSIEAAPRWRKTNLVDWYYPGVKLSSNPAAMARATRERERLIDGSLSETNRAMLESSTRELAEVDRLLYLLPAMRNTYIGSVHTGTGNFRGTGNEGGKPRPIHVLRRGNVQDPRQAVGPGTVPIIPGMPSRFALKADASEGEARAWLARWITDERNPLTWRSIVNRVWLYHFGRGLVDSPNDFGRMGQLPSHPELLDWLVAEFRDGGQSLKSLHRMIVTSAAYRQSSATNAEFQRIDSGNVYLWRMNRRRLEAEAIRDAVLVVSGKLNPAMGGPGFRDFVIEHPAHSPHYEYKLHDPADPLTHRRSIYRFIVRSQPQPFMTTLDCADPSMSVEKRNESLTALQALALLNNRLMVAMAGDFAQRLEKESGELHGQLRAAYQLALGRTPTATETARLSAYAKEHGLANACRVIFNLSEFVFVD